MMKKTTTTQREKKKKSNSHVRFYIFDCIRNCFYSHHCWIEDKYLYAYAREAERVWNMMFGPAWRKKKYFFLYMYRYMIIAGSGFYVHVIGPLKKNQLIFRICFFTFLSIISNRMPFSSKWNSVGSFDRIKASACHWNSISQFCTLLIERHQPWR